MRSTEPLPRGERLAHTNDHFPPRSRSDSFDFSRRAAERRRSKQLRPYRACTLAIAANGTDRDRLDSYDAYFVYGSNVISLELRSANRAGLLRIGRS